MLKCISNYLFVTTILYFSARKEKYDYAFIMHRTKKMLAIRLKELRVKRKLSQEQLAELVNVSPKTISQYETGRIYPTNCLDALAFALDVEPYMLFKGDSLLLDDKELMKDIIHMLTNLPHEKLVDAHKIITSLYS